MSERPTFPAAGRARPLPCIVIVGGGAGGLQLATRLGNTLGRKKLAEIVLIDRNPTHFWKPLLHEAASGHRDPAVDAIEYAAQARQHAFRFVQGELSELDRTRRVATVAAIRDADGTERLPARALAYDELVLAIGSVTHFFGVPGAAEHALTLENVDQAEDFRRRFLASCEKANYRAESSPARPVNIRPVNITVIGAGATGVELVSALRHAAGQLAAYRFPSLDARRDVSIRLIEAGPRVVPALDERTSALALATLRDLPVSVETGTAVAAVEAERVVTASGRHFDSDITIWAAGVAGSAVLRTIGDLTLNRANQVIVTSTLQTPDDPHVYAFGDCAACPSAEPSRTLPPRAQVAFQQAVYLSQALTRRLAGKHVAPFRFHDAGTVVSFGARGAVFQSGIGLRSRSLIVGGLAATGIYKLVYRKHLLSIKGATHTLAQTLSRWLLRRNAPSIKLH